MENGRSPVLGSSLAGSEGTELMEGAAAAVGRKRSLSTSAASFATSYCSICSFCFTTGSVEFQLVSEGQQESAQNSIQTPPTKKSSVHPADGTESMLPRPPTLHKQPPALLPKPFNRLPNHITGELYITVTLHTLVQPAHSTPPPHPLCRRWPGEAAVHDSEDVASSTSKEAHDLRTFSGHGAPFACLPEVPRTSQSRSDGWAPPSVRHTSRSPPSPQPHHRGAQQDTGAHYAEV